MYPGNLDNDPIIYLDSEGAGGAGDVIPRYASWIIDNGNPKTLYKF